MHIYSVSEFIESINEIIGGAFVVEGEVSGYNVNQNKWVFFNLKEEGAVVGCFMTIWKLDQKIEDGMKIRVIGKPEVFKKSGRFTLVVEKIELVGQGSLQRAFELLKTQLQKEGLFAPERKRPLPEFPERVGIITSRGAAAYTDFLRIASNRFGGMEFLLYDARVQGNDAPDDIAEAFDYLNRMDRPPEVIVLMRGGGSLEDLQAFNTEKVARAIFSSRLPVIVGVGHERDETIADYVADVRASTPSNAAERLFRDRVEVGEVIDRAINQIEQRLANELRHEENDIKNLLGALVEKIEGPIKRVREIEQFFIQYLRQLSEKVIHWGENVDNALRLLLNIDPKHLLSRGYSIARRRGKILKTTAGLEIADEIETQVADGLFVSKITVIKESRIKNQESRIKSKIKNDIKDVIPAKAGIQKIKNSKTQNILDLGF